MNEETKDRIQSLVEQILASPKYRNMGILDTTVRDVLEKELPMHRSSKDAVKSARKKLHNIVAPYLGDPDYAAAAQQLTHAFATGSRDAVEEVCTSILSSHASTKERLSILDSFYPRLFALTGQPKVILDLACGLNPFAFPWMGLPASVQYYAYDIHQPRVALINHYFKLEGLEPLAEARDILVSPPEVKADAAFFFKEAHRVEQRQHGSNLPMWQALNVRYLLVSLPTSNLTGHHSLIDQQRHLVYGEIEGQGWPVEEMLFENEIVFCIRKGTE